MELNGREIGFYYSVKAATEVAKLCPGGDPNKLKTLFSEDMASSLETAVSLVSILSTAYENHRKREDPDYTPNPATREELEDLSIYEINPFVEAAVAAMLEDSKTTVETEAPKGKNGDAASE